MQNLSELSGSGTSYFGGLTQFEFISHEVTEYMSLDLDCLICFGTNIEGFLFILYSDGTVQIQTLLSPHKILIQPGECLESKVHKSFLNIYPLPLVFSSDVSKFKSQTVCHMLILFCN